MSSKSLEKLPKIELHAHLSGSVRDSTLLELYRQEASYQNDAGDLELIMKGPRDLATGFKLFSILHKVLNQKATIARVVREILQDFESENVVYMELRTTLRDLYRQNELTLTKREYLDTVIEAVKEFESQSSMIVRLIVSVDRSRSIEDNLNTIQLCKEYMDKSNQYVVGVDFSGNPKVSTFKDMRLLFDQIKEYKLKTTVHIAEHWEDPDLEFILKEIKPDRIGHSVCLTPEWLSYLLNNPIPIEICPTSNLITKCVDRLEDHVFGEFYKKGSSYPLCICTDDRGIFKTSLTNEYSMIQATFGLNQDDLLELNRGSLKFIFDQSEETRHRLTEQFKCFK